jgi:hypothetical protein
VFVNVDVPGTMWEGIKQDTWTNGGHTGSWDQSLLIQFPEVLCRNLIQLVLCTRVVLKRRLEDIELEKHVQLYKVILYFEMRKHTFFEYE